MVSSSSWSFVTGAANEGPAYALGSLPEASLGRTDGMVRAEHVLGIDLSFHSLETAVSRAAEEPLAAFPPHGVVQVVAARIPGSERRVDELDVRPHSSAHLRRHRHAGREHRKTGLNRGQRPVTR